jgi:hypothetical protein
MALMLQATRSAHIVGRESQKEEKRYEKQDYQDSSVDGDVARKWLGLGSGRYYTCASLLSEAMSTEVMLVCGRGIRACYRNSVVWGGWLV